MPTGRGGAADLADRPVAGTTRVTFAPALPVRRFALGGLICETRFCKAPRLPL
jgi:hypothetical protein